MKLTLAICTWNRAQMLAQTLDSFCQVAGGEQPWELLVVDNNSIDGTQAVCDSFYDRLPIRTVIESRQGHSVSRNRAVDEAQGELIVWTDDDVVVDKQILNSYRSAFAQHPDAGFFGGKIQPRFESPPPKWITDNWEICAGMYAARDLGEQSVKLDEDHLPYGANFASVRAVQKQFPFQTHFGRVGSDVRGFDEIDVFLRMLDQGYAGYWVPSAHLEHLIPNSRATLRFARDYFRGQGQTWITRGVVQPKMEELEQQLRRARMQYWLDRLRFSKTWFPRLVHLSNLEGQRQQLSAGA